MTNISDQGFVAVCNTENRIKKILCKNKSLPDLKKGNLITAPVEDNNINKMFDFLADLNENNVVFDREINISTSDNILTLKFSGVKYENNFLILAYDTSDKIMNFYDEISKINNNYVNKIRKLIKLQLQNNDEQKSYNKISQLNNELTNLQRQLQKKNMELQHQKEKYRITLANIKDAVITIDENGNTVYLNEKAEELTCWSLNQIAGEKIDKILNFFAEGTNKRINCNSGDILDNKNPVADKREVLYKNKCGKLIPVECNISVIRNNQNNIGGAVIVLKDITERKKEEEKIRYLSYHDQLTGLYNRRYFASELDRLNKSRKLPISIIVGDMDGLKYINDNYGHQTGDKYIKKSAEIINSSIRKEDIAARIGGDEFAVILPETSSRIATEICRRIERKIKNYNKNSQLNESLKISTGFATKKRNSQNLNDIFDQADKAMYENKRYRKNSS